MSDLHRLSPNRLRSAALRALRFPAAHRAFVTRLRRVRGDLRAPGVPQVLRRNATHVIERQRESVRFLAALERRVVVPIAFLRSATLARETVLRETRRDAQRVFVTRLVERFLLTSNRLETRLREIRSVASPRNDSTTQNAAWPPATMLAKPAERLAYPPVAQVLARPGESPGTGSKRVEADAPSHAFAVDARAWPRPPARPIAPKPVELETKELSRVADFVIRELDHRARSYRERMGGI